MDELWAWAEKHPALSGGIVFGVGLLLLWWMGVFGSSNTAADNTNTQAQQTQQQLATAYYAAEAAQATAGTQLQIAQVNDQAATNINSAQVNGAVAIDSANNVTGQLQATTAGQVATTQANDALQASENGNLYAYQTAQAADQAENYNTLFGTTLPYELALTGGSSLYGNFAGTDYGLTTGGLPIAYPSAAYPLAGAGYIP